MSEQKELDEMMSKYVEKHGVPELLVAVAECIRWIGISKRFDNVPIVHGKWLLNGQRYCECSVCHHEGNTFGNDLYCPHCGAKMDRA